MRTDFEAFFTSGSQLEHATRARLEDEHLRLKEVSEEVRTRESDLYALFQDELTQIKGRKEQGEKDIKASQTQLQADKVYLGECEERVEEATKRINLLTSDEREQLERERIAIETEQDRINEDEEKLKSLKAEVQVRRCGMTYTHTHNMYPHTHTYTHSNT